ncbi:MAG: hypothetical protein Q9208_004999 [Pyrenodesmia sp. 3 TL-2023]
MSLTFALQSLLARHEAYVLDAEEERRKMASSIDRLECDKKELEAANARTIEENRTLLDQLESLNNTVSDSQSQIQSLTATLQSTRKELDRLNVVAARTSDLESQLSLMETEHSDLHEKLTSTEEGQRSAMQRWKDAERMIRILQEQVDRIEAEARDESERHVEVMSRFERRQAVERQLESAAGRLKGAAAAKTLGEGGDGNNHVVSHFVKDILADNASLQMGIMELREMLMGSNDEVQNLREQMLLHQAVPADEHQGSPGVTLEKNLSRSSLPEPEVPALHVHHHYHEASKTELPARRKSTGPRRARRRRSFVGSGMSTPRSGSETPLIPRTPSAQTRPQLPSSASTILSQTSASIPRARDPYPHPLSTQSANTRSSVAPSVEPDSPHPSMFDFLSESSRPTSPDSMDAFPPPVLPLLIKEITANNRRGSPSPTARTLRSPNLCTGPSHAHHDSQKHPPAALDGYADNNTIVEEPEQDPDLSMAPFEINDTHFSANSRLRRSASHESILSVAGVASKQLRGKHSQLFRGAPLKSRTSLAPSSPATSLVSSRPVISTAPVTVASSSSSGQLQQTTSRAASSGAMSTLTSSLNQSTAPPREQPSTIGKRMGGWVWGKWGVAPMASTGNLRAKAAAVDVAEERPTGVNQKGSLRALRQAQARKMHAARVEAEGVDEGLLRETLGEG